MQDEPTFTVIQCLGRRPWGATFRLRLDVDVDRDDRRWGHDNLGAPMLIDRSFRRPAGWEVEVMLIIPNLEVGDKVPLDTVLARLHPPAGEPRPD